MPLPAVRTRPASGLAEVHPLGRAQVSAPCIRVFAIDTHPLCLRGMAAMLTTEGQCGWTGEAANVTEALASLPMPRPDVLLVEHRPPAADGVASIEKLRPLCPQSRFVLVANELDAAEVRRALLAGVACVLHKSVTPSDLLLAVRAVHGGQRVVPPVVAAVLDEGEREAQLRNELTPRERTLLTLMAQGLDNRAIAGRLHITVPTVKFHITNIMSKLHAANRTAAVLVALRMRLVSLHPTVTT